jgi:hypothetical protein
MIVMNSKSNSKHIKVFVKKTGCKTKIVDLKPQVLPKISRKKRQLILAELGIKKQLSKQRNRAVQLVNKFQISAEEAKELAEKERLALQAVNKIAKSNRRTEKILKMRRHQDKIRVICKGLKIIQGGAPGLGKRA